QATTVAKNTQSPEDGERQRRKDLLERALQLCNAHHDQPVPIEQLFPLRKEGRESMSRDDLAGWRINLLSHVISQAELPENKRSDVALALAGLEVFTVRHNRV